MFSRSAHLYDLLYLKGLGKDYATEATLVADLLPPTTRTLLDVACGTGLHLEHLAERFECVGVDIEPGMLDAARARCPNVPLHQADMVDLDLGRTFDAVVCLFSSIGYVGTDDRLHAAIASMARHVSPGGVLVVEPWLTPDTWTVGHPHLLVVDEPDLKIVRASVSDVDDGCSVIEFHYLVATAEGIDHFTEEHRLALFKWQQYCHAFEAAGLETTIDETGGPTGRGLVSGRRPS